MREKNQRPCDRRLLARNRFSPRSFTGVPWTALCALCALCALWIFTGISPVQAQEIRLGRMLSGDTNAEEGPPVDRIVLPIGPVDRTGATSRDNPCGPYAITALANFNGKQAEFEDVAQRVTANTKIGIGPVEMMRAILSFEYTISARNDGALEDIVSAIRVGNPVVLLVDTGENEPHWALVKGFETEDEKPTFFYTEDTFFASRYRNEHGDSPDGAKIEADQLVKYWDSPIFPDLAGGLVNWATGYKRYMIICHRDGQGSDDIPLDSVSPASLLYVGVTDFLKGARDRSVMGSLRGLTEASIAAVAGFHHVVFSTIRRVGEMVDGFGEWLADVGGPAGTILGLPFQAVGTVVETIGGGLAGLTRVGLGFASRLLG